MTQLVVFGCFQCSICNTGSLLHTQQ